jgi:hypothetical protein
LELDAHCAEVAASVIPAEPRAGVAGAIGAVGIARGARIAAFAARPRHRVWRRRDTHVGRDAATATHAARRR